MDALEFLATRVPLFAGLGEDPLFALAKESALKQYQPGHPILMSGMSVDNLHVIAVGDVGIHVKIPNKGVQCVATLGPGEVFGESSILEQSLAGATVRAGETGAVVLLVPEAPFRALYESDPALRGRVDALIASRRAPAPAKPPAA